MSNTKVFILQDIIPSYRVPIFRRLAALDGLDTTVFYSRPSKVMQRENLKSASQIEGFKHIEIRLWEFGSCVYQFGILWRVLLERPDVIIAGQAGRLDTLLLLLLAKILKARFLWFLGGVPYLDPVRIKEFSDSGRLNRWFGKYNPKRLLSVKADGVIAYSDHAKQFYIDRGFSREAIWVAPNSPDTDALEDARQKWQHQKEQIEIMRKRFSPAGEKVLFLLGRLNGGRKVDTLLHAVHKLQKNGETLSLVIVGDGNERESLEKLATELGLVHMFFEGAIYDEHELSKYFLVSDIFVVTGVASLAVKMAMFFAVPVVTVDYGLEVHAVKDGINGLIFPIGNADILAKKIQALLGSASLRREIGEGGIHTIRHKINITRMMEGFRRAIYAELDVIDVGLQPNRVALKENESTNARNS